MVVDGASSDFNEDDFEEVVPMDERIKTYRKYYAQDLARRLEMDKSRLPSAYTHLILLNLMFGLEPSIVGSGLMTRVQYKNARDALLKALQDELDAKNPVVFNFNDSDSGNSLT